MPERHRWPIKVSVHRDINAAILQDDLPLDAANDAELFANKNQLRLESRSRFRVLFGDLFGAVC